MADGRRIYHKAWCGGGGAGVMMCSCSARGSREAPGVMCVPLLQSLEADGGDISLATCALPKGVRYLLTYLLP